METTMIAFCRMTNLQCENRDCFQECNSTVYSEETKVNESTKYIPCIGLMPYKVNLPVPIVQRPKIITKIELPIDKRRKEKTKPKEIFMEDNYLKSKVRLTGEQSAGKEIIYKNAVTIIDGIAGSGKTFLAFYSAIELFWNKQIQVKNNCDIQRIIFCTPIPDNDELGFLRGTLDEKLSPRILGAKTIAQELMSKKDYQDINSLHKLKFYAISHIRGLTFEDAFVIVDEAQNLSPIQIKLLVSRIGKNSKIVFCGDESQIDLKDIGDSGYPYFKGLANNGIDGFSKVEFIENNRHPIISKILHHYSY